MIRGDQVLGVKVESETRLLVESDHPRHFFGRLPGIALTGSVTIRSYATEDDDLESLFGYLLED